MNSIFKIVKNSSKWSGLRKVAQLKVVQSMYIWLIIVPLFSKLFSKIEDTVAFTINENTYFLDLDLPFSWVFFFIAALLFTIGNAIFIIFSPKIIQDNWDYGDFTQAGKGMSHLNAYLDGNKINRDTYLKEKEMTSGAWPVSVTKAIPAPEHLFWWFYEKHDASNLTTRTLSFACFFLGGLLIIYILFENIGWVFSQLI